VCPFARQSSPVHSASERVKKWRCRGGPYPRPGATIPRLPDSYGVWPESDFPAPSQPRGRGDDPAGAGSARAGINRRGIDRWVWV
jgi:hypothetical protein